MEKNAGSLSGRKDNVYAFPPSGKEIQCIKCDAKFIGEKCPICGIPAIPIPRQDVLKFPGIMPKIRICPKCGEETRETICPGCGENLFLV